MKPWIPHEGNQTTFLARSEFEVLFGGSAGPGKTDCLVAAMVRDILHPHYHGLILRRTYPQLQEIIDRCHNLYPYMGGKYLGTSYNFYDAVSKKWHQTWVDNTGGHLFLSGGLVGNDMQLSGQRTQPDGKVVTDRIIWTPQDDGSVRQHWQSTTDQGQTWVEVFDGYYRKD